MKQTAIVAFAVLSLFSCKEDASTKTGNDSIPAKLEYAYTIQNPDNWERGDLKHVQTVMAALKAYETGDIAASVKNFGDSVELKFDGYEAKLSNDSLKAFFAQGRSSSASITIKMDDWESVISKDGKTEYVSLWYKEIRTDMKGKTDSVETMDDVRIEKGKIVSLNQKIRQYAVKK